jgi:hypothetical protein
MVDEAPVRRRDGVELAELWGLLRRQVEERPAGVPVVVRVRRERLDMFRRICAANLAEGDADGAGDAGDGAGDAGDGGGAEWAVVGLRFAAVPAARTLLSFGDDIEVVSPGEVRADLAAVAAAVVARYA